MPWICSITAARSSVTRHLLLRNKVNHFCYNLLRSIAISMALPQPFPGRRAACAPRDPTLSESGDV